MCVCVYVCVCVWGGDLCPITYSFHCHHQNDSALRWAAVWSHFNVSLIVRAKSRDSVRKPQFLKRKESRSGSNRGPSAYQHPPPAILYVRRLPSRAFLNGLLVRVACYFYSKGLPARTFITGLLVHPTRYRFNEGPDPLSDSIVRSDQLLRELSGADQ